jgi:hypothetical protein
MEYCTLDLTPPPQFKKFQMLVVYLLPFAMITETLFIKFTSLIMYVSAGLILFLMLWVMSQFHFITSVFVWLYIKDNLKLCSVPSNLRPHYIVEVICIMIIVQQYSIKVPFTKITKT